MYLKPEEAKKLIIELTYSVSQEFEEKYEFMLKLLKDDDWSFVIKSHSLIESLVTELIIAKIDESSLKNLIERIPLHGEPISKISIVKIYDLIPSEQLKFIKKLSEIRNSIVHKYENLSFTFEAYLTELDKNNNRNWKNILLWESQNPKQKKLINKTAYDKPKVAVWMVLGKFVGSSLEKIHSIKGSKRIDEQSMQATIKILNELKS